MKNSISFGLAALALTISSSAFATGGTSSTNIEMYASVAQPINITEAEEINFGGFWSDANATDAVLAPNGTLSGTANVATGGQVVNADPDADGLEAGQLYITGEPNWYYTLTGTSTGLTGPGATMAVDNVVFYDGGVITNNGQIPAGGQEYVAVGATLHINGSQASGSYSGAINVTASYN